jgi:hypothetical protein
MTKPKKSRNPPPAATGNAGGEFQAQVGAYYLLLAMAGAAPRGLPGAVTTSISFQQAAAGFPLDDVVVLGRNDDGSSAVLEIQATRTLRLTAKDEKFGDIIGRALHASRKPEFAGRYELGIASSETSTQVYTDVLKWARVVPDGAAFRQHLDLYASIPRTDFVEAVRGHLKAAGGTGDDNEVWSILSHLQVLDFAFGLPGASHEERAVDLARLLLAPEEAARAASLWSALVAWTLALHANGGSADAAAATAFATQAGFKLAPSRGLASVVARLAEEARLALKDIGDSVGGVTLARPSLLNDCVGAMAEGRLLEIVGARGSGKSSVLKQLMLSMQRDGTAIVLARGRIVGGGWPRMASALGCPAAITLQDLLRELGAAGPSALFVDNIDQIEDEVDRRTLVDLLRAAAENPAWRVVVTSSVGDKEWQSGLAPEIKRLGPATVIVGEINDTEAALLGAGNPKLALVLRAGHPARNVARNLFNLSQLLEEIELHGVAAESLATETDMARAWWKRGGGRTASGAGRDDRLKALRALAARSIARPRAALQRDDLDSVAINELMHGGVLVEERPGATVNFRHDVLRDWAMALLLQEEPERLAGLPLDQPVPASLARGIEIAARLALEADPMGKQWLALLGRVEVPKAHGSWRRPALIAVPRAENAFALLDAISGTILEKGGARLVEMIRLVIALDSEPMAKALAKQEAFAAFAVNVPETMVMPAGPSWARLVSWIVARSASLPPLAIPDAAKLLGHWLMATSHIWLESPAIVALLHAWLSRMERSMHSVVWRGTESPPMEGRFDVPNEYEVRNEIRMFFLAFCHLQPALAAAYLAQLAEDGGPRHDDLESIVKLAGALPRAAPGALVDFTLAALLPKPDDDDRGFHRRRDRMGPFNAYDTFFFPAGPSQGPMLELLRHAPAEGLRLVRGLVEHATHWYFDDAEAEAVPWVRLSFRSGSRAYRGTSAVYQWARGGTGSTIATCALMALEAWGHAEIEGGRDFGEVLEDVLGPGGGSLAFVCVAVDLALSHWEVAKAAGWPLLTSPELFWHDNWRHNQDVAGIRDYFTPTSPSLGKISAADLTARPSRRQRLIDRLGAYALHGPEDVRQRLTTILAAARDRIIGDAAEEDDDAISGLRATAVRAMRYLDPGNWLEGDIELADGRIVRGYQYQQSADEIAAVTAAQGRATASIERLNIRLQLQKALLDPSASTPELAAQGVRWARANVEPDPDADARDPEFDRAWHERARVMAAAVAARDYDGPDRDEVEAWCLEILDAAAREETDAMARHTVQIASNKAAIAALGFLALFKRYRGSEMRDRLFRLAVLGDGAVLAAISGSFLELAETDPRLPPALVRVVLSSSVRPHLPYDLSDAKKAAAEAAWAKRTKEAIAAEETWLNGGAKEPDWPTLPPWPSHPRRRNRIPIAGQAAEAAPVPRRKARPDVYVDLHSLGVVANALRGLVGTAAQGWVSSLGAHLLAWTIEANNGPEDEDGADRDNRPFEWNSAFFGLVGAICGAQPFARSESDFLIPMTRLHDEAFHDAVGAFLPEFDFRMPAETGPLTRDPEAVRALIAERLMAGRWWSYRGEEKSYTIESHTASALNPMFFQFRYLASGAGAYIGQDHPRLPGLMPSLADLVISLPRSGYLAALFLTLVETSTSAALLPHVVRVLEAWAGAIGVDADFWLDKEMGVRACAWLARVLGKSTPTIEDNAALAVALDVMVRSGVVRARDLETMLADAAGVKLAG